MQAEFGGKQKAIDHLWIKLGLLIPCITTASEKRVREKETTSKIGLCCLDKRVGGKFQMQKRGKEDCVVPEWNGLRLCDKCEMWGWETFMSWMWAGRSASVPEHVGTKGVCRARLGWGIGRAPVSVRDGEQHEGCECGCGCVLGRCGWNVDGLMKGGSCQFI